MVAVVANPTTETAHHLGVDDCCRFAVEAMQRPARRNRLKQRERERMASVSGVMRVAFLPAAVRPLRDHAVALIDVMRTGTTVVECFTQGARAVYLAASGDVDWSRYAIDDPLVLAEVRGGEARPGAAFAPSPSLLRQHPVTGRHVVICTVNGAVAAEQVLRSGAAVVLLASLVNLEASARRLHAAGEDRAITLVCSGYGGNIHVALDDVYVAGRLAARVLALNHRGPRSPDDSTKVAMRCAQSYPAAIDALRAADTAEMLNAIGRSDDVELCARVDISQVVPEVVPFGASRPQAVQVLPSEPSGAAPAFGTSSS